ncbi:DNA topoisomerase [Vibrio mediterranei]
MKLYVAEKRDVADAIVEALGNKATLKKGYYEYRDEYQVSWCWGHLLSLTDPEDHDEKYKTWRLEDLPLSWPIDLKPIERTQHQLNVIYRLMSKATEIVSCTDPDAAGQRIFDDIYNTAKRKPVKVYRALFNDNNPEAIVKALNNLKPNSDFLPLYLEDRARSVGDQRVGYNLSRAYTTQSRSQNVNILFTVGRVQSAILGLCVNRERNRKNHKTANYYTVTLNANLQNGTLKAKLEPKEELGFSLDHESRFNNQNEMNELGARLEEGTACFKSISRRTAQDSPILPHDLLSLQVEASRLFGLKPDETLDITQKLRELRAITYNRCDTRYYTDENHEQSPQIIANLSTLPQYQWVDRMDVDTKRKSRAFNSSKTTAHHALMPTGNIDNYDKMTQDERRIYALICRNYIVQFMPKRRREVTTYEIELNTLNGEKYTLNGKSSRTIDPGWEVIFAKDHEGISDEDEEDTDENELDTSHIYPGEQIPNFKVDCTQQATKPAPSYTMETLLKDLQHTAKYLSDEKLKQYMIEKDNDNDDVGGVGTAATRSDIIKKLFDHEFLQESNDKKPKIYPTERGYALFDILPARVRSPEMTAIWANELRRIREREIEIEDFLNELDNFILQEISKIKSEGIALPDFFLKKVSSGYKAECPLCNTILTEKDGKFGHYYRCDDCKVSFSSLRHKLVYAKCDKCESHMRLKKSKKGHFLGCSNYPKCKNTASL